MGSSADYRKVIAIFEEEIDKAYQRGYEAGYAFGRQEAEKSAVEAATRSIGKIKERTFNLGLNTMYQCIKEIVSDDGIPGEDLMDIFGVVRADRIFNQYSAEQILDRLAEYKRNKVMDKWSHASLGISLDNENITQMAQILKDLWDGNI